MKNPAGVIGWLVLSAVLPGAAHLRAGWKRTGLVLLLAYLAMVLMVTGLVVELGPAALAGWALGRLPAITVTAGVLAAAWCALIVHSFLVLRPGLASRRWQAGTGVVAALLALLVALPFAVTARYAAISQRTLDQVFTVPGNGGDPLAGKDRVNILLLGGDWDPGRVGTRTDSVNVASIDVRTGNTVLFGLPRNLEDVRFPPGSPMRARFPYGFRLPESPGGDRDDLLYSVWGYANEHPEIFGGRRNMGPATLKETVGYTLGLKIDWYALVNIWGFARIIDALGGLVLNVERDVVYGRYNEGRVKAGLRRLDGAQALWYARSRTFADDFTRMRRQRCVFDALLRQADPGKVLTGFDQIARATQGMIYTDLPRGTLPYLVPLMAKIKNASVRSVQFVPPLINTGYPDWNLIRETTARALKESAQAKPETKTGTRDKPGVKAMAVLHANPVAPSTAPSPTPAPRLSADCR
ncbi:LCP family protein [Acrocarpospora catenulata]|uniref:LCP family protein n=1 Tax=Acrocarpospora catenulata TaxID=2836182 RepID=UPI0027E1B293|nr:LCP family protein [Acrocarpospora catenulata]